MRAWGRHLRRYFTDPRFWVWLAVSLAIIPAVMVNIWIWEPAPWDPLGQYPVQEIHSRVPGVAGPALSMSSEAELRSTGIKCNSWPEPVDILGYLRWVRVEPRGLELLVINGIGDSRLPGCTTFMFSNPQPEGLTEGVWQIRGREVPVRGGREGVPRRIMSENFVVVP